MAKKYIYLFSEGNGKMKDILGGKGANLAEMTSLNMPVPPGFTISSEVCSEYHKNNGCIPDDVKEQIFEGISKIEAISGKKFGSPTCPLLLSVRSGARVSMPGMMDTILNLGINDEVAAGLSGLTKNPKFAYDSFRRFIQMFSDVVYGIPKSLFDEEIEKIKDASNIGSGIGDRIPGYLDESAVGKTKKANGNMGSDIGDRVPGYLDESAVEKTKKGEELSEDDLRLVVEKFKKIYKDKMGESFPLAPKIQLIKAVEAVFKSWDNPRAEVYRKMNKIPYSWGTAVNIQMMVFGNFGNKSGTGVAFSRNPATGENTLFGEYLINAQGEDVVAGIRTPSPIESLKSEMPDIYNEFKGIAKNLEKHYSDVQDMEFTIENGKLYMLQTRNAKRTAEAAVKIACDLVKEGKISKEEAFFRVTPEQISTLLHKGFEKEALSKVSPIGKGLAASPGAACGEVIFDAQTAKLFAQKGKKVILVRLETSPEDIEGMTVSEGILTARGGMTSHASVVARGMGKCCVSGCDEMHINENEKYFELGGIILHEGDILSIDGSTGYIYQGAIPTVSAEMSPEFAEFMSWINAKCKLDVLVNADCAKDIRQALRLGAKGVGLCRTEHMFFDSQRIKAMREMIVAQNSQDRKLALNKLLPFQKKDFENMFLELKGLPMTVRFLDPPLHEFLPKEKSEIQDLAGSLNISMEKLIDIMEDIKEFNPMMGHRGCRLLISYPEITQMQTHALISAALDVSKKHPEYKIVPEIMIPLVGDVKEFVFVKKIVKEAADELINTSGSDMKYKIGTMIELPRAALTADKIAKEADFFSFGTNDLTQMTFGFSRDDASKFLNCYYDRKIFESDPFKQLDIDGVGKLIETACVLGRDTNPKIKLGVCGEHGGEAESIKFLSSLGIDYVSCSPFRVASAKLAAVQAELKS